MRELSGEWREHHWTDILLHARVRRENDASIEYEVRELEAWDDGESELSYRFRTTPGFWHSDSTPSPYGAQLYIWGRIRFDGCSHNHFTRDGYLHGCQREHLTRLGVLYDRLYDEAAKLLDSQEFLAPSPLRAG